MKSTGKTTANEEIKKLKQIKRSLTRELKEAKYELQTANDRLNRIYMNDNNLRTAYNTVQNVLLRERAMRLLLEDCHKAAGLEFVPAHFLKDGEPVIADKNVEVINETT